MFGPHYNYYNTHSLYVTSQHCRNWNIGRLFPLPPEVLLPLIFRQEHTPIPVLEKLGMLVANLLILRQPAACKVMDGNRIGREAGLGIIIVERAEHRLGVEGEEAGEVLISVIVPQSKLIHIPGDGDHVGRRVQRAIRLYEVPSVVIVRCSLLSKIYFSQISVLQTTD